MFSHAVMVAGLLSAASAHMVMKSPVPYGKSSLTNGPLAGDGSDFPCKQRFGVYDITTMNSIAVGVPQTMSFMGSAVHGGGSCQVSVTLDLEPTKQSTWKVIHSIIGGCPSNVTGNLAADPNGLGAAIFDFKVPEGFPNGKATLAWTWLNKIGNREFYMNCAPIEVSGGSSNKDVYNALPDMFVANIPATSCGTTEGEDFVYPNPGNQVVIPFSTALGSKTLGASCQQPTGGSSANQQLAVNNNPAQGINQPGVPIIATTPAAQPLATTTAVAAPQVPATTTPQAAVATTLATVIAPAPAAATPAAPAPAPAAPAPEAAAPAAGTCLNGTVSCPTPGSIICIGSAQFGLCDINFCAVPQSLALGTSCKAGTISKRSSRHLIRHLEQHKAS